MKKNHTMNQSKTIVKENKESFPKKSRFADFFEKHVNWILPVGMIFVIYICYFIFAYPFISSAAYGQSDFIKGIIQSITALLILGGGIYLFIAGYKKKLTKKTILFLIFFYGFLMRICFMIANPIHYDNYSHYQHDLSFGTDATEDYPGHYSIIMWIFRNNTLPDMYRYNDGTISWSMSSQLYQPKTFHIIMAMFMKFNSIFIHVSDELIPVTYSSTLKAYTTINNLTYTEYTLFNMNAILTCYVSCMSLFVLYKIFKELRISENAKLIAVGFIAFCPIFYFFTTSMTNDSFSVFFMFIAILFTIKWMKKPKFLYIIIIAITCGLGIACKLSVGVIALFIAVIFLLVLIHSFKNRKNKDNIKEHKIFGIEIGYQDWYKLLIQFVIFAVIVFPLGLWYQVYAYIRFGQSPFAVWEIAKYNWNYMDPEQISWAWRYLLLPFKDFFTSPYCINRGLISGTHTLYQDIQPNIWNYALKSSLFGEYVISRQICGLLYLTGLLFFWFIILLAIYLIVKVIYSLIKKRSLDTLSLLICLLIGGGYIISFIVFNIRYPFSCSQDFRYIVPLVIVAGIILAKSYDYLSLNNNKFSKVLRYMIVIMTVAFMVSSIITYVVM